MSISIKKAHQILRKKRIRSKISGTSERPRLTIYVSNYQVSAQLIDDVKGNTLASSTSQGVKEAGKSLGEKATWVGADIAAKAKSKKIKSAVLDRNGKPYHGRIAALADSARKAGLEI